MAAIISEKFRIFNAKQFLESLSEAEKTNMYFFVGRSSKWDVYLEIHGVAGTFQVGETVTAGGWSATVAAVYSNSLLCTTVLPTATTTPAYGTTVTGGTSSATATSGTYSYATEEIPPLPLDNQIEKNAIYDEIIAAKRINSDAARLCVPRYNWTPSVNPKFDMYRPNYSPTPGGGGSIGIQTATGQNQLTSAKFYVMNSQYEVFKCLYNGQSPANPTGVNVTDEPKSNPTAGQGTFANGVFTEENGNYIWKHMFTLPTGDVLAFLSTDFMPIAAATDSSRTAVEGLAVDGAVHIAVVSLAGSGLPASNDFYAKIVGDGTGGIVKFSTDGSGTITGASIQAAGNGYTYANVVLEQGNVYTDAACTTTATVAASAVGSIEAVISPEGGHGSNSDVELVDGEFYENESVTVRPLNMQGENIKLLSDSIIMFWTGLMRPSELVLEEQDKNNKSNSETLDKMKNQANELSDILNEKKISPVKIGDILHKGWVYKKTLASKISNNQIDNWYECALKNGAYGGKISGAGGGGFLTLIIDSKMESELTIEMEKMGLKRYNFGLDSSGTKVSEIK